MKKILAVVLLFSLFSVMLVSCDESKTETSFDKTEQVRVLTISGPTGMGMAQMMKKNKDGSSRGRYDFKVTASPNDILASIVSGETDIAACPINLASKIYHKTNGSVQILAVNTLGVLYIVTNGVKIRSFSELDGKTVVTSGSGAIPEVVMDLLCQKSGISVDVQYVDTFANAAGLLASGEVQIAMLAEPSVSSALLQNKDLKIALNLNDVFEKVTESDKISENSASEQKTKQSLIQGCVIVRTEFAKEHPEEIEAFLKDYKESVDFVTALENADAAAGYCEEFSILPKAAIAKQAFPRSSIVLLTGEEMKKEAAGMLQELYRIDPASIGGKLPERDFYYETQT